MQLLALISIKGYILPTKFTWKTSLIGLTKIVSLIFLPKAPFTWSNGRLGNGLVERN